MNSSDRFYEAAALSRKAFRLGMLGFVLMIPCLALGALNVFVEDPFWSWVLIAGQWLIIAAQVTAVVQSIRCSRKANKVRSGRVSA